MSANHILLFLSVFGLTTIETEILKMKLWQSIITNVCLYFFVSAVSKL